MSKRHKPSANKRAQTQKTAVIDNNRPNRLSAAVVRKIPMQLWNTDSDNENDTDSHGVKRVRILSYSGPNSGKCGPE